MRVDVTAIKKKVVEMKQNFEIELTVNGIGDKITLQSRTTLHNANRVFDSLRVYLHGSLLIGKVDLYVKAKDTRYKLNGVNVKGGEK